MLLGLVFLAAGVACLACAAALWFGPIGPLVVIGVALSVVGFDLLSGDA